MPIVVVELLSPEPPPDALASRLADALGPIFESPVGHTWVRCSSCDPRHYAESADPTSSAPRPTPPSWAFVRVTLRAPPDEDGRAGLAARIAAVVAEATARPLEDVHVLFEPPAAGRIAFGGELVRTTPNE